MRRSSPAQNSDFTDSGSDSTKPETNTVCGHPRGRPRNSSRKPRDIVATPSWGHGSVASSPPGASTVQPSTRRRTRCVPPHCSTRPALQLYTARKHSQFHQVHFSSLRWRRHCSTGLPPPRSRHPPAAVSHEYARNNSVFWLQRLVARATPRVESRRPPGMRMRNSFPGASRKPRLTPAALPAPAPPRPRL